MRTLVEKYCEMPSVIRKPMWKVWHNIISSVDKQNDVTFMNYGYLSLNGHTPLDLAEEDETDRICINLYHEVANQVDLTGKNVLEVGSGRGGGASYIKRYLEPETYTGVDISKRVIDFCNDVHDVEGLNFKKGIAEDLDFNDQTFDAVVNVESARCYADVNAFFREVNRVLVPDGHFLFADMIKDGDKSEVEEELHSAGFEKLDNKNITQNVVKALDHDHERRNELIESLVPKFLQGGFLEFAGAKGSQRYNSFASGEIQYWVYLLKKAD
jgi:ubiquinone/menaquinone biosynthesis C-methylase UbiE